MRKFIVTGILGLMMAAVMTGCGSSKSASDATTTEVKSGTTATSVNYSLGLNEDGTLKDVDPAEYVTLCDYSKISLAKEDVTADDSSVQSQIDSIVQNFTTTEQVKDREVKDGDVVNIDYKGSVDGKEFEGGTDTGYNLTIGSGTFIDDFEQQLIGHKPGETVQVKVTFPENYQSTDLAGKDAVFETVINYIQETKTPEVTDDFVKENLEATYGYTSVDDMKAQIKEQLEKSLRTEAIWNYMLENCEFKELPEKLIDDRYQVIIDGLSYNLAANGATLDDYLSAYGYEDTDALKEVYRETCESTVKIYMISDLIAKNDKLSVTDDALKEYFGTEDYSGYVEYYTQGYVNRAVLNNLVAEDVEKNVTFK